MATPYRTANPFRELVQRLAAIEYRDADEGDERIHIAPPATIAELDELSRRIGGPLPDELQLLCEATTGFSGPAQIDVGPSGSFDQFPEPELGTLFQLYDYGNGDGLWFEPSTNELWWMGHDPYDIIYVGDSLLTYVRNCVEHAESVRANELEEMPVEEDLPYSPLHRREPIPFANASRELAMLVDNVDSPAWIWDLRDARPRTEASCDGIRRSRGQWRRRGRIVVMCSW